MSETSSYPDGISSIARLSFGSAKKEEVRVGHTCCISTNVLGVAAKSSSYKIEHEIIFDFKGVIILTNKINNVGLVHWKQFCVKLNTLFTCNLSILIFVLIEHKTNM